MSTEHSGSSPSQDSRHNVQESPANLAQHSSQSGIHSNASPLSILGDHIPFDHHNAIVAPFEDESRKDMEFLESQSLAWLHALEAHEAITELQEDVLDATIEFYAWASARSKHEEQLASARLEQGMQDVIEVEKQQGRSTCSSRSYFGRLRSIWELSNWLPFSCMNHRDYQGPCNALHWKYEGCYCCIV
jgi:hypothetical protein